MVLFAALLAFAAASYLVVDRLGGDKKINRPGLWRNTAEMALEYPLTGTGLGSFKYVFPRYQEVNPDRRFSHAEGDWIQYFAETGAVGVLLLLAFGVGLVRVLLRGLSRRGSRRALAAGGFVGLAGIVLHGFVDTSLHIPANMVAATVLLGGTVGPVREGTGPSRKGDLA
jgi:O-antigen ligase